MSWWRSTTFLIYGMRNFGKKGYEAMRKDKNYEDMNALDLKQKSIMITGANAGLGFAATLWFATHGSTQQTLNFSAALAAFALHLKCATCQTQITSECYL
jgi:hypothetical protein